VSTRYDVHNGVTASYYHGNDIDLLELYRDYALAAEALADALPPDDNLGTVVRWVAEQARPQGVGLDPGGVLPLRLFGEDTGETVA
jgi:hypothetical protein